jgi:hypothetical protein
VQFAVGTGWRSDDATRYRAATAPAAARHDGSYKVGRDIAVGTWHTDGPLRRVNQYDENGNPILVPTCHWATGGIGEQNGAPTVYGQASNVKTGDESGPRDITISPSDNDFTTIGCKPWQLRP